MAIFLISSSLANWTDPQNPFLEDSIRHMLRHQRKERTVFTTLVAVVDRLPAPCFKDHDHQAMLKGDFEGLSLHLGISDRVNPDLLLDNFVPPDPAELVNQLGVITVGRDHGTAGLDSSAQRLIQHSLQVPLANTIFTTGRLSTMYKTKWLINGKEVIPLAHHHINQQRVNILPPWSYESAITVPLAALTPARKVLSSMGNIVRRIEEFDGDRNGAPASLELERAISGYSETSPRRLAVWACLYPPEMSFSDLPPGSASDQVSNMLTNCLPNGARLHKVLSGGGGWGSKQGLLSLDPEQSFVKSKSDSGSWDEEGYPWESGESDVVEAGDRIQFFASAPESSNNEMESEHPAPSKIPTSRLYTKGCVFGVCGSVDEQVLDSTKAEVLPVEPALNENEEPLVSVFPHHFGALSEKGINITYELRSSEKAPVTIGQTKLDVAYSKIRFPLPFPKRDGERYNTNNMEQS